MKERNGSAPFFTIITVCLNAGQDLIDTVKSVLNQTFEDFEIIIKDGLSNDGSIHRIPADKRIRFYQNKDTGLYEAMNQALSYVEGRYLVFLNAGDVFYSPSVLSKLCEDIAQNPGFGLYYCDYTTTSYDKRVFSPRRLNEFTLFRNMLCHQCCFFEVNRFRQNGDFNTNYRVVADYDYLLRFLVRSSFAAKSVDVLGIIYKSGGFAFVHQALASREVETIRRDIFGYRYFINSVKLKMTFPALRNQIVSSRGYPVRNIYSYVANLLNRRM